MTITLLSALCAVLLVWVWVVRDAEKIARRNEQDMAAAIAAEDGSVLELLAKYDGLIECGKYSDYRPRWVVRLGAFRTEGAVLADTWASCVKYIRAQEAVEAVERAK